MGITSSSERSARTTVTLEAPLLEKVDALVAAGQARSRNQILNEALRRELKRREREAIDAEFVAGLDEDYLEEAEQIMAEFAAADSETARMIEG